MAFFMLFLSFWRTLTVLLKDFKYSFGERVSIEDADGNVFSGIFGGYEEASESDDGLEYIELKGDDGIRIAYPIADYSIASSK